MYQSESFSGRIDFVNDVYDPLAGSHLSVCLEEMARLAKDFKRTFTATFNGLPITAAPGVDAATLAKEWERESENRSKAWRESKEGKKYAALQDSIKQAAVATVARCVSRLDSLDFSDIAAVLGWVEEIQEASDHIGSWAGAGVSPRDVASVFVAHGYLQNANCDADFNGEDRENFGRYILGQAIDGLSSIGAIHPICHKFIAEWRAKFQEAPDARP